MKKFTLFTFLIAISFSYAQTLPIDFEQPEDDAFVPFNGATATVLADPTDATNTVLELTSAGDGFDGATLTMGTFIDLSDDSNNTITMEFWTPDATPRTHLLQFKGGTGASPQIQLFFDTDAAGWQTITLDFSTAGPTLSADYFLMDIFADAGSGNTATGTYYIDDIDGPNGASITPDPIPSTAAPVPNVPDSEVYSFYNDTNGFSTIFPVQYSFGNLSGEPDLDDSADENKALKFNFGVAGWGQGEGAPDDVSAYNFVSFDYWAGSTVVGFDFVLISNDGGVTEHKYQVSLDGPIVNEAWTKVEIPMSFFTNIGFADTALFQWKVSPLNDSVDNGGIVYMDNVLLTQNSLGTEDFVTNQFSVYPNPTLDNWNIKSSNTNILIIEIFNTLGRLVKEVPVNNTEAVIDASDLSSGIYFARIYNDNNQNNTIKLIKS